MHAAAVPRRRSLLSEQLSTDPAVLRLHVPVRLSQISGVVGHAGQFREHADLEAEARREGDEGRAAGDDVGAERRQLVPGALRLGRVVPEGHQLDRLAQGRQGFRNGQIGRQCRRIHNIGHRGGGSFICRHLFLLLQVVGQIGLLDDGNISVGIEVAPLRQRGNSLRYGGRYRRSTSAGTIPSTAAANHQAHQMDATVALAGQAHPQRLHGLVNVIVLPILPRAVQIPTAAAPIDRGYHEQYAGQRVQMLLQPTRGEDAIRAGNAVVPDLGPLVRRDAIGIAGGGKGVPR